MPWGQETPGRDKPHRLGEGVLPPLPLPLQKLGLPPKGEVQTTRGYTTFELSAETSEPVPLVLPPGKSSEPIPWAVPLQPPRSQHRGRLRPTVTSCDPATNCDLLRPAPPRPSLVRMALALNFLLPLQLLGTKAEVLPTGTQRTTPHVLKSSNEMSGQNPTAKPRGGNWRGSCVSSPPPLPPMGKITPDHPLGSEV